jgi:hypothetical protein
MMMPNYNPIEQIGDRELIRLVLLQIEASRWDQHQRDLLAELISRFEAARKAVEYWDIYSDAK